MFVKKTLFIFAVCLSEASAETPACLASFTTPYYKWKSLPVEIYVDKKMPTVFTKALINGIDKWNASFKENVFLYKGQSKECDKPEINCLTMKKAKAYQKVSGDNDYAFVSQAYRDNAWESADIVLNASFKWKSPSSIGQVDPSKVVLHELGHVLGLQHHFFHLSSIMNYLPYEASKVNLGITSFDKEMVDWIYFNGKCPTDYLLASIDQQNDLSRDILKKQFPDLSALDDLNLLYLISRLEKNKDNDRALLAINKALVLSQDQSDVTRAYLLNQQADLYFLKDNNLEAFKAFEESHKLWPGNYLTLTYLAQLKYIMNSDRKGALKDVTQALTIRPDYQPAKELKNFLRKQK